MNKSKIINIVIIVIALALIVFLITKEKKPEAEVPVDETPTETENNSSGAVNSGSIPVPAESSWTEKEVKDKLTFDAPAEYYISYPVIGGCKDVVSISTQTPTDPTIAVAMIYKEGCVTDTDVTMYYSLREVKDGYVFQSNSNHPTVRAVFDRIVESAEVK